MGSFRSQYCFQSLAVFFTVIANVFFITRLVQLCKEPIALILGPSIFWTEVHQTMRKSFTITANTMVMLHHWAGA